MRRRSQLQIKRQVWRITPDAAQGRWVDPEVERIEDQPQPEERFGLGLRQSSLDLAFGLEVLDATETVPRGTPGRVVQAGADQPYSFQA